MDYETLKVLNEARNAVQTVECNSVVVWIGFLVLVGLTAVILSYLFKKE